MRFLLSTYGSAGDVFPLLGLAIALRSRGHDVTFATNEHYGNVVEQQGFPFHPLGTEEDFQRCVNSPDLWHPRKGFKHIFESFRSTLFEQYELYNEFAKQPGSIGIANCFGLGAFNVRDEGKMPVLTFHCQPAVLWSDIEPPLLPGVSGPLWMKRLIYRMAQRFFIDPIALPFLNQWRSQLKLPPIKHLMEWWHSKDGVLALFPEWYCRPQVDWPSGVIQTDFPLWNAPTNKEFPSELDQFLREGTPPIAFTPGSANTHGKNFFEASIGACKRLNRRAILLSEFDTHIPKSLPPTVMHVRYVPLEQLMPRCSAFVHHGGIGSASQALAAGIPQLIMPLAHDQFDNAGRIKSAFLGDWLLPKNFNERTVARKLEPLLNSDRIKAACRETSENKIKRDGLERTAIAIEKKFEKPNKA